ncbi:MAG: three-Cys-motif partner protein TcmP [Elusimicrobiota bacterium]
MKNCEHDNCKDKDDNYTILGEDGLTVQCVGPWAEEKYDYLTRYLNASQEARRKFFKEGNAIFIDLFSGPGKCIIKDDKKEIDGGCLRALSLEVPFNEYYLLDISEENLSALRKRTQLSKNCFLRLGDSNLLVKDLLKELLTKPYRYHFAYIDPFGPDGLKFDTLKELAKLKRMDMLIHFPIGAMKRNIPNWLKQEDTILDQFLGTNKWRNVIKNVQNSKSNIYKTLIDIFKEQLLGIGYPKEGLGIIDPYGQIDLSLSSIPVRNTKEVNMYTLILIAKHKLAQKLWNSVIKKDLYGNRSLF